MKKTLFVSIAFYMAVSCVSEFEPEETASLDFQNAVTAATTTDGILLRFKPRVTQVRKDAALRLVNGTIVERFNTKMMETSGDTAKIYHIRTTVAQATAIKNLKGLVDVEWAESNFIYIQNEISNDPSFVDGSTWALYGPNSAVPSPAGINVEIPWSKNHIGSSNVYIGIIDEGVKTTHEDLVDNIWVNPNETAGNGIDDDANGYIDDVNGWDFVAKDNSVYDGIADDHGTHMAGIIGAKGGNGIGTAGICWNVKMLTAKALDNKGGSTVNVIKALDYFTYLKNKTKFKLVAVNMSFGNGGNSKFLLEAIERANKNEILLVTSAGNNKENIDYINNFPSSYYAKNIIAVGAIGPDGALTATSSYGPTNIDLFAPGQNILSTLPTGNGYGTKSGTSTSAAFVTGAVALYAAANPTANANKIKMDIMNAGTYSINYNKKALFSRRLNLSKF